MKKKMVGGSSQAAKARPRTVAVRKKSAATSAKRQTTPRKRANVPRASAPRRKATKPAETGIWETVTNQMSRATDSVVKAARATSTVIADGAQQSVEASKVALRVSGDVAWEVGKSMVEIGRNVRTQVSGSAQTVGFVLLDFNKDGKIDQADLKIAMEQLAAAGARGAQEMGSSETVKGTAKAAAVFAVIAIPVPIVGPAGGAAAGAAGYLLVKAFKEVAEAFATGISAAKGNGTTKRKKSSRSVAR